MKVVRFDERLLSFSSSSCQLVIAVGIAGPQLPAPTACSRSQWASSDLSRQLPIPDRSGHCRTSTGDVRIAAGTAGPQPPDRVSRWMLNRLSEYMWDRMPEHTSDGMPDRMSEDCQNICQIYARLYVKIYVLKCHLRKSHQILVIYSSIDILQPRSPPLFRVASLGRSLARTHQTASSRVRMSSHWSAEACWAFSNSDLGQLAEAQWPCWLLHPQVKNGILWNTIEYTYIYI